MKDGISEKSSRSLAHYSAISSHPARSGQGARSWDRCCVMFACSAVLLITVLCISGCRSGSDVWGPSEQSSIPPGAPRAPYSGDLRFQQVDAPSQAEQGMPGNGEMASDLPAGAGWNWPNYTGTPLELAWDNCNQTTGSFSSCAWGFSVLPLPSGQCGLGVSYQSGLYGSFASDVVSLPPPSAVVVSLDLEPANGAYAMSWTETDDQCSFDMKREVVPLSQVQSAADEDASQSRVITAVAFDASGQVNLISYGWSDDADTVYETSAVNVAGKDIGDAATGLAQQGYIITAFGGNTTRGYLLIGTKVSGDTTPRPTIVATQSNTPLSPGATAGYALVGFVCYGVNITATGSAQDLYAGIYEK